MTDDRIEQLGMAMWCKYDTFTKLVKKTAQKKSMTLSLTCQENSPKEHSWGYCMRYIPGLTTEVSRLLDEYEQLYNIDPFSNDMSKGGEALNECL